MPITIRRAEAEADRASCLAIRMEVFVDEQGVPADEELDAFDAAAEHYLAVCDGEVVGTARLVEYGPGLGKIGRVAVKRCSRGHGAGDALMKRMGEEGFARYPVLILDAQLPVIPFYERHGFVAEGEVFMDAGIPHRRMTRHR